MRLHTPLQVPVVLLMSVALAGTFGGCASRGPGLCPAVRLELDQAAPPVHAQPATLCAAAPQQGYPFKNLVLQGGGVKGIAYGGSFEVLQEQGILDGIERVAGTSAGAITAALVSLRYEPRQIQALMMSLDFSKFEDGGDTGIVRVFRDYGWYRGDYFLELMRCLVGNQTGNPHATFADLHNGSFHGQRFRDLHVFATDLTSGAPREYSFDKTPGTEVALAVRMSMSIPLFFAAVAADKSLYVDGGVLYNYPIHTFDSLHDPERPGDPERLTLGLVLDHTGAPTPDNRIHDLPDYLKYLLEAVLNAQTIDLELDPADLQRSVIINNLGISTTDFQLTLQQKLALIDQGVICTCAYLDHWRRWDAAAAFPASRLPAHGYRTRTFGFGKCGAAFD